MDVVEMAQQVLDMHDELQYLRGENERLRKYEQLYRDEIRAGEAMMANIMELVMAPGAVDACRSRP